MLALGGKRILPSLLFVLLTCLLAGIIYLLNYEIKKGSESR